MIVNLYFCFSFPELWQVFSGFIRNSRCQQGVLWSAGSHLCFQWSSKPSSDLCHSSARPRIQGKRTWHTAIHSMLYWAICLLFSYCIYCFLSISPVYLPFADYLSVLPSIFSYFNLSWFTISNNSESNSEMLGTNSKQYT